MVLKGNKGEWSELYTFFKILADGKLYAADSDLNRIDSVYYPVIKVIRKQLENSYEYCRNGSVKVIEASSNQLRCDIPVADFIKSSDLIFENIKSSKETTFSIKEVDPFLNELCVTSIKAASSDKSDITLVVHDLRTGLEPLLGFSIKSRLGSPSTLFNASSGTNFIYRVDNIADYLVDQINSINTRSKIRDRIQNIEKNNGSLVFVDIEDGTFKNNLQIIDSNMPLILSSILLNFYRGNGKNLSELTNSLEEENPCNFSSNNNHQFYIYKIKSLLTDIALGMTPKTVWSGSYDATGGYIVVKEDGDLVCYHIYNRNEFQNYLLKNTKLDTPSSSRYGFGELYYGDDDKLYIKLNLQIRFKK